MVDTHGASAGVSAAAGFPPTRETPRQARAWAQELLGAWSIDGVAFDVLVVLSELVTNAVLHGAGVVDVELVREPGVLRLAVCDQGSGVVCMATPAVDAVGGRGLVLVDHLAQAWGVRPAAGGGKTVWANLRTPI
jgi:anti-sigma regulatory factor (Ser/Thr protein kinase)